MKIETIEHKIKSGLNLTNRKIIAFGAGNGGELLLKYLEKYGVNPVYFCDNDKAKWNTFIHGIIVQAPEKIKSEVKEEIEIIITSGYYISIIKQLGEMLGIDFKNFSTLFDYTKKWDKELMKKEEKKIRKVIDYFSEMKSKKIYQSILKKRMEGDIDYSDISEENQYFVPGIIALNENEVFVDVGAYNGRYRKKIFT